MPPLITPTTHAPLATQLAAALPFPPPPTASKPSQVRPIPHPHDHLDHADNAYPLHHHHHRAALSIPALALTLATILASLLLPRGYTDVAALPIATALIAVFGIPHGAVDHKLFYEHAAAHLALVDHDKKHRAWFTSPQVRFYTGYLGLMAVHALFWIVHRPTAFAAFLALAVYHFGHGDFEYLGPDAARIPHSLAISRGLVTITLIACAHPNATFPVMEAVTGVHFLRADDSTVRVVTAAACAVAVLQHLLYLAAISSSHPRAFTATQVAKTLALTLLFTTAHAYLAFSVYFAAWHSAEFFVSVTSYFGWSAARTAAKMVPYALPVLGAVAAGAIIGLPNNADIVLWRAFLVVVSVVTTPHVVFLEAFTRHRAKFATAAAPAESVAAVGWRGKDARRMAHA
ncbi:hypothetical protein GGF31_000949 [Allomyces arbusculus]|nr:hypothetical protein GGF31_000949 [Allomyces arbusculus]